MIHHLEKVLLDYLILTIQSKRKEWEQDPERKGDYSSHIELIKFFENVNKGREFSNWSTDQSCRKFHEICKSQNMVIIDVNG